MTTLIELGERFSALEEFVWHDLSVKVYPDSVVVLTEIRSSAASQPG